MRTEKRYDIVPKEAREKIKGIDCILEMVDEDGGWAFHDSIVEKLEYDSDADTLIVDIGDVWNADQDPAGRFRFIFKGYMEIRWSQETGNYFTYDFFTQVSEISNRVAVNGLRSCPKMVAGGRAP